MGGDFTVLVLHTLSCAGESIEIRGRWGSRAAKLCGCKGDDNVRFAAALGAVLAAASAAHGEALRPMEATRIALGDAVGVAYYTVGEDGYQVVATVAVGDGAPVRFVATLLAGQQAVVSVPQGPGEPPIDLEIAREGDAVFVSDATTIANLN